jgi:Tfp pilus assembly protein PilO
MLSLPEAANLPKLLARNNQIASSISSTTQGLPIYPAPPVKNMFSVNIPIIINIII